MPVEERFVFEPACGHAGFLVGALRLLDELRPDGFVEDRVKYLRKRLYGVDVDAFSQEVARLALTLADVPNPNGWKLGIEDIFLTDVVEKGSRTANIVLANPPFENFKSEGRSDWLQNKAAETLSRIVHNLPVGGVLGFIGPQGILQSRQASELRKRMLDEYEIDEVTIFADEVFQYGDPETALIIAKRVGPRHRARASTIQFRRVREGEVAKFAATLESDAVERVFPEDLCEKKGCPLFVPELAEVWDYFAKKGQPTLEKWALLGQGLFHKGIGDTSVASGTIRESDVPFPNGHPGFAGWGKNQFTHDLPQVRYLNLDPKVIDRTVRGMERGIAQVLLNYPPVSRGPWRLKALLDYQGHPFTSDFVVARPISTELPISVLWAVLNSPLANAYTFCWLSKRHNLVGRLREMPMPIFDKVQLGHLERLANEYLDAAKAWSEFQISANSDEAMPLFKRSETKVKGRATPPDPETLKILHLRVDAAVMAMYDLPRHLERRILDLFDRESDPRKGVPFHQVGYFPKSFTQLDTATEYLAITDWDAHEDRKMLLIEKKVERIASDSELQELEELKRLSAARRDLLAPIPMDYVKSIYDELMLNKAGQL